MRPFVTLALCLISGTSALGQQTQPKAAVELPFLVLDAGGHSSTVPNAVFTADGKYVVTASHDKTIRVWDLLTGETIRVFRLPVGPANEGSINCLALSPDSKTAAVAGWPYGSGKYGVLIHLVDLENGRVDKVLTGHRAGIACLAFSPDGKRLASGSGDKTVRVYELKTGKADMVLEGHTDSPRDLAFAPDGKWLATVDRVGRIWSLASGKAEAVLTEGNHPALSVAWSPDGKTVAIGNLDATISLWNPDGKLRKTLTELRNQMTSVNFTADSKSLLLTGVGYGAGNEREFGASIVDLESCKERARFKGHNNTVLRGNLSRDGTLAVSSGGDDHDVWVWRTTDGSPVEHLVGRGRSIWAVGWSTDSTSISWGTTNRYASHKNTTPLQRSFDLEDFEITHEPAKYLRAQLTRGTRSFDLDKDFHMLIKDGDQVVHKFDGAEPRDRVYCFTWLPDGRAVVGTSFGQFLLDPATGKVLRRFQGHTGIVLAVAPAPDGKRFVTGSVDQTIRIWDPEREQPLLTLFIADQDWIAWTDEGVYAASANGERLMGWQINNGPEAMASYHSAAQFRKSLYHPDVIRKLIPAGSLAKAFAMTGKKPEQLLSVTQVLPPFVAITSPAGLGTVRLNQTKFDVKATAKSTATHAVRSMRLLVDGRPYRGQSGFTSFATPKLGEVSASWSVELAPGSHVLSVLAESGVSRALSSPVSVMVAGGGPESQAPALYVVAAGINDYPGELRLQFAATDADAISKALQAPSTQKAFRAVEIKLLKDKEATKKGIESGLSWLQSKMTPQDVGVFFFSGHGDRDLQGNFYLVPVDVSLKDPYRTCVSGDSVKQKLADMPGRLIAVLDACHSGAASEGRKRRAQADDLVRDLISDDYGIIVMSSSLGKEYSLESPKVKAGFFTLALVEGLAGQADLNRDGVIYLSELEQYTNRRVKALSEGKQNPIMAKPPTIRSFPLAKP
jgi:WD40 repeat protein